MSNEEKEKLKEELKKEIKEEMENQKNTSLWNEFVKECVVPVLDEKIKDNKVKYQLRGALNTIARIYNKKNYTNKITKEEMVSTKVLIYGILQEMGLTE